MSVDTVDKLRIKRNDLQPYYYFTAKDQAGAVIDLAGATIRCTMRLWDPDTGIYASGKKIDRQTAGINVTDAAAGEGEYQWQAGETDTSGIYRIEFEVTPGSGGKFTIPNPKYGEAEVVIHDDLDAT